MFDKIKKILFYTFYYAPEYIYQLTEESTHNYISRKVWKQLKKDFSH
jgi:hypothetical protein